MSGTDQFARAALFGALNSLWIALALAGAAWTLARCLPRTNAATRHLLWWAVLALVLLLPFGRWDRGVVRSAARGPAVTAPSAPAPAVFNPPLPPSHAIFPLRVPAGRWLPAAMALWALFGLVQLFRIAWSFAYLHKVKRGAYSAPDDLGQRFRYWVAACGIRRPVRLLISRQIASPMATGFRQPAVILPAPLVEQFGEGELDHVLLHELAHVARRDDWTNLAVRSLGAIAGLHPVAAWAMRQIGRERELACDDWVVSRTGAARPYAASLARLFELCRARRRMVLAAGMAGSASHLGERIEILLDSGRQFSGRASLTRVALTAMALLALVAAGARAPRWIVLAQSAQSAQSAQPARSAAAPVRELPRTDRFWRPWWRRGTAISRSTKSSH
jgi:beta-lactamase regulating signal transducer with metallopeptidase domain